MAILCDVDIVRRSGCPYGHTDERSSCSQAVIRRGVASGIIPFSAKNPPPLTIVASTFSYSRQRSMPPWASRILLSSWFINSSTYLAHDQEVTVDDRCELPLNWQDLQAML